MKLYGSYAARISSGISGANHVINDSTWCVFSIVSFAFSIRLNLNGHLLQRFWLAATC